MVNLVNADQSGIVPLIKVAKILISIRATGRAGIVEETRDWPNFIDVSAVKLSKLGSVPLRLDTYAVVLDNTPSGALNSLGIRTICSALLEKVEKWGLSLRMQQFSIGYSASQLVDI